MVPLTIIKHFSCFCLFQIPHECSEFRQLICYELVATWKSLFLCPRQWVKRNEHIEDAMEDEGDEEESNAVALQVFDELGLQLHRWPIVWIATDFGYIFTIIPFMARMINIIFVLNFRRPDHYRLPQETNNHKLPRSVLVVLVVVIAELHWTLMLMYKLD